jgi:hypothetical protein
VVVDGIVTAVKVDTEAVAPDEAAGAVADR